MTEHTPGPWQVDEDNSGQTIVHLWRDETGTHTDEIADVVVDYADGIADANANLLAAAPDLHEALRRSTCSELSEGVLCQPCRKQGVGCLRLTALAKAEGQ